MISDVNKGITNIIYNHLNLPESICFGANCITFLYDANGNKLQKTVNGSSQDYLGGIEYKDNVVEAVYHEEGRATPSASAWQYEYYLKDHLGNTRVIFSDTNNDDIPEIIQEADYYPFGMRHDRSTSATNHYLYNGKELNEDLGLDWYDYGFRWYDAEIGRFPSVDPLSSRFSSESNYSYAGNSPTVLIDVDGKFKFDPQTLKILKEKYPTAYKYLVKTDINTPGNILSYANDMQIMSILIRNTNYYHCTLYWDNHTKEGKPITNKMAIDMMNEKEQILKEGDILRAFTYGNGPEIKIGDFPNCIGGYNNGQGGTSFSSALEIHPRYFEDLERASSSEDKQAALVNLVSIIFHEFTEGFADDRTDLFGTGEFGAAMAQYQIFADKRPGIYRDYDCEFDVNFQSAKTAIERLKECGNYYNPSFIPVLPK